MSFTGQEDHSINLSDAAKLTKNYRDNSPGPNLTLAHFFGKDAIQAILNQEDCVGIRIYYGLSDANVKQLVVVGVKANEDDMVNGLLAERSKICPPMCSTTNALNS